MKSQNVISKSLFILQYGCRYEGYSVLGLCDTLLGAKNWPREEFLANYNWVIEEVPVNGKPIRSWFLNCEGEWAQHSK